MFLNRTKDPVLAAQAASEQKKLVELVSGIENEDLPELEKLTDLLRSGVDPSVPDYNLSLYYAGKNFYSPIHYAVKKGFFKVADLLLNSHANPNALDRYSVTPAHLAADIGSVKCLKKLIEFGADVSAKTQDFRKRADRIEKLQKLGIETPKEFSQPPIVREQELKPEEFTFYILPFEVGSTPLHLAAKRNHIECVKLLIDQGADYNATDEKGQTSLYLAAKGMPDCVTAQLQNAVGFPILSIPTTENDTALHECLRHGEKMGECIKELVHRGADVSLANRWGESAIHLAVKYKWDMDMIRHLVLEGYGMDFDRQKVSGCKKKWTDTPLLFVVGDRRVHNIGIGGTRAPPNRDENLAAFFLQMGATRQCLKDLLWHELNREEKGGCLLETLMNSFAYLPPFSELRHRTPEEENDAFSQDSSDEESVDMDLEEPQEAAYVRQANRDRDNIQVSRRQLWPMFALRDMRTMSSRSMRRFQARAFQRRTLANADNVPGNRDDDNRGPVEARNRVGRAASPAPQQHARPQMPTSMIAEKHRQYAERCREIPSLAHLSRSTIRNSLQADVRKVISFPIPKPLKEYILLGYQLSPPAAAQDQDGKQQQSAPEESSSESVLREEDVMEQLGTEIFLDPIQIFL